MAFVNTTTTEVIDMDWSRLEEAMQALPTRSERPPDSFTVAEYATKTGLTHNGAMCRLKRAVISGVLACSEPVQGLPTYYWVKEA